ncbi:hypothetical protein ACFE04_027554 [Oxalis oulophora]
MDSLLSDFDGIYDDFKSAVAEIKLLKSNYLAESKKREAFEFTSQSLHKDNERLIKLYTHSFHNLADQLEHRTKCKGLKEELHRLTQDNLNQQDAHRKVVELLKQDYATKIGDLEAQIRHFQLEKTTDEATINLLRQDLTAHKMHMQVLGHRLDHIQLDVESKYNLEIQDLKDCLMLEREEKNELINQLKDLEKEVLIGRTKLVEHQHDSTSNQHVETMKLKIMKLRTENEILKRRLSSQEG